MQKISAGKFHFEPPFTSFDHLVGEREQLRRDIEAERLGGHEVELAPPHGHPSSGLGPHITRRYGRTPLRTYSKNCALMSQVGQTRCRVVGCSLIFEPPHRDMPKSFFGGKLMPSAGSYSDH